MSESVLRLYDDYRAELIEVPLHPADEVLPLSYLLKAQKAQVYATGSYSAQLSVPRAGYIRHVEVQLNHYPISATYYANTNRLYFAPGGRSKSIFADAFGFARFTIRVTYASGPAQMFYSDYIEVITPLTDENYSVNSMGAYIARHNPMLFYGTREDYDTREGSKGPGYYSLEDKIRQLKQTATLFERSWRLIRLRPRKAALHSQNGSSQSMQASVRYLLGHPEALHRVRDSRVGLRIGMNTYIPDLSHVDQTLSTTDVYENQVTLSFLKGVCDDIEAMIPELAREKKLIPARSVLHDKTITNMQNSAAFLYEVMKNSFDSTENELRDLLAGFRYLYQVYSRAIPARLIELKKAPTLTPAFRQLPAYRLIYESISRCFARKNVSVGDLRFVRTFLQITEMYEVYVLTKLGEFFESSGFQRIRSYRVNYTFESDTFYKNTEINNVYIYQKDDLKITLYYQPVIYNHKHPDRAITGLGRSTSISMPIKGSEESSYGTYYTPDYVFRIESPKWKGARYILGDAKYSTSHDVKKQKIFPLIFKYLFSISPIHPDDQITGLYVFNGRNPEVQTRLCIARSIYDLVRDSESIFPQVEIISLYEYPGTRQADQFEALQRLFTNQIEKARAIYERPLNVSDSDSLLPANLDSQSPLASLALLSQASLFDPDEADPEDPFEEDFETMEATEDQEAFPPMTPSSPDSDPAQDNPVEEPVDRSVDFSGLEPENGIDENTAQKNEEPLNDAVHSDLSD